MLLFEFFPLFVALVGVIAAVLLYMKDRSARANNEAEDPSPLATRRARTMTDGPVCVPACGRDGWGLKTRRYTVS
jgi:hypothetical protein